MPEVKRITSRENPAVIQAAALLNAAERTQRGLFLAEGLRLCADAAKSGASIRQAFYTKELAESRGNVLSEILGVCGEAFETMPHVLEKLSCTRTTQGIVCVCEMTPEPPGFQQFLRPGSAVLAMERVQDPANLGAAARTAEALGFSAIILSDGSCSPYNPKALRASMGAFFRIPVKTVGSMADFICDCAPFPSYATVVGGDARPVTATDFSAGGILLIGNEGAGLSDETTAACTFRVTIPMTGRAESLNASAAAAILMWEMRRG